MRVNVRFPKYVSDGKNIRFMLCQSAASGMHDSVGCGFAPRNARRACDEFGRSIYHVPLTLTSNFYKYLFDSLAADPSAKGRKSQRARLTCFGMNPAMGKVTTMPAFLASGYDAETAFTGFWHLNFRTYSNNLTDFTVLAVQCSSMLIVQRFYAKLDQYNFRIRPVVKGSSIFVSHSKLAYAAMFHEVRMVQEQRQVLLHIFGDNKRLLNLMHMLIKLQNAIARTFLAHCQSRCAASNTCSGITHCHVSVRFSWFDEYSQQSHLERPRCSPFEGFIDEKLSGLVASEEAVETDNAALKRDAISTNRDGSNSCRSECSRCTKKIEQQQDNHMYKMTERTMMAQIMKSVVVNNLMPGKSFSEREKRRLNAEATWKTMMERLGMSDMPTNNRAGSQILAEGARTKKNKRNRSSKGHLGSRGLDRG